MTREAFEAWKLDTGSTPDMLARGSDGRYVRVLVQRDWETWQAARELPASVRTELDWCIDHGSYGDRTGRLLYEIRELASPKRGQKA